MDEINYPSVYSKYLKECDALRADLRACAEALKGVEYVLLNSRASHCSECYAVWYRQDDINPEDKEAHGFSCKVGAALARDGVQAVLEDADGE